MQLPYSHLHAVYFINCGNPDGGEGVEGAAVKLETVSRPQHGPQGLRLSASVHTHQLLLDLIWVKKK